jgi:hypothetical protein
MFLSRFRIADVIQSSGRVALEAIAMNEARRDFSPAAEMAELTELIVGQIRKLAELHEAGILTDEEFTAKKAELLERL